mmetsp:Transcript_66119/g.166747  ORF Transcript_66119/g.166747 Transcript_66119/m.166747 type:complete len:245 (+) Transcript_66119:94-828(+)
MAPRAWTSLTTEVIKQPTANAGCQNTHGVHEEFHPLPVSCGAVEYIGWSEHRDIGNRMRMRLLVLRTDSQWCGEWEVAGHQHERVSISFPEQGKFVICNVEGRHHSELCGQARRNGILFGSMCQDGVGGGRFRLWPINHEGARKQLLQRYVNFRSGPCQDVPLCKARQELSSECAICLDSFVPGDMISWTPCSRARHVFHRRCIQKWLESHATCPICRHVMHPESAVTAVGANGSVVAALALMM